MKYLPRCFACTLMIAAVWAANAKADSHAIWFPMSEGSFWTYSDGNEELTFTVIGTDNINGKDYYRFDDFFRISSSLYDPVTVGANVLFRYDPALDAVVEYDAGGDIVRYDYANVDPLIWTRQSGITCTVPAGEYDDCFNFAYIPTWGGQDAYMHGEYVAPIVGLIRHAAPGGEFLSGEQEGDDYDFQLIDYDIEHFFPSFDDDGLSLLLSNWHKYTLVGDMTGDFYVDDDDLSILLTNWHSGTPPSAEGMVPEPATAALLALGAIGLGWRKR